MPSAFAGFVGGRQQAQCLGMTNYTELPSVPSDRLVPFIDQLRLAMAAYLARFEGSSRDHTESDLRCFLAWCAERGLDLLAARRPHLELYIRWMQEILRFKPSAVSRRFSVAAGFYKTCVIDGLLDHSPAACPKRPRRLQENKRPPGGAGWKQAQCLGMMTFTELPSISSNRLVPFTDQLQLAVAAYLASQPGRLPALPVD